MGQRVRCGFKSIAKKPGGADVLSVNLSLLGLVASHIAMLSSRMFQFPSGDSS